MINVAILGLGVVGSGTANILRQNKEIIQKRIHDEINIKYILDLRDFPDHPLGDRVVHDINIILNDPEVQIVAELMGGLHPAFEFSVAALKAKKSVVTSNKEVVATCGVELIQLARENKVSYMFEASVGGGIPIIRPTANCLAANNIEEITGILNGTTNYILTQMIERGITFDTALREAQQKGYAERNPDADILGLDTCRKICILCAMATGKLPKPEEVYTEGITSITLSDIHDAAKYGAAVKLIGQVKISGSQVFVDVRPRFVRYASPLSHVNDVFNAIMVKGDFLGEAMFYGRGAGADATASAVVGDMLDVARHINAPKPLCTWEPAENGFVADVRTETNAFYIRFEPVSTHENAKSILRKSFPEAEFISDLSLVTKPTTEDMLMPILSSLEHEGLVLQSQIAIL